MATVSAKVFEYHKKTDGTYNVKICVHHKSERRYLDTAHYVVKKQLTAKMKIKDNFVNDLKAGLKESQFVKPLVDGSIQKEADTKNELPGIYVRDNRLPEAYRILTIKKLPKILTIK